MDKKIDWKAFLDFQKMITPMIIKFLFWLGVGIVVLGGIIETLTFVGMGIKEGEFVPILVGICGGPIATLIGVLGVRIYAELLILFFQINENLTEIKENLR